MTEATIRWHVLDKKNDEELSSLLEFSGFYAIIGHDFMYEAQTGKVDKKVDILYIGMGYRENVLKRIGQPHVAFDFFDDYLEEKPEVDPFFMIGRIESTSLDIISRYFFNDIQCLLIKHNEPLYNVLCPETKNLGRNLQLQITNTGDFGPLEEVSRI